MDAEVVKTEIKELLEKMGYGPDVEDIQVFAGAIPRFNSALRGEANMLIGERGGNLAALEYILKRLIRRKHGDGGADYKFLLDINDYRAKRLENLKQDIKAAAKEVRLYKKEVPLNPMSSFERRITHMLLAEYPDITTESVGEEPNRRVIIKPYP